MDLQSVINKSSKRLENLNPWVYNGAIELIKRAYEEGIYVRIVQGYRSIEEQNALYAQGRTTKGQIVTQVHGGYSYHNYGLAVDFCLGNEDMTEVYWDVNDQWWRVVEIAEELGFEAGARWTDFQDTPHIQMAFGLTCQQLMNGAEVPEYVPQNTITEEEVIALLSKYFRDIPADHWSIPSADRMYEMGIIKGNGDADASGKSTIGFGQPITSERMAVMLDRIVDLLKGQK